MVDFSDVHSVDGGNGEESGIGHAHSEGPVGDLTQLALLDGETKSNSTAVNSTRVEAVLHGETSDLPVGPLLSEALVRPQCVERDSFGSVGVVEVVSSRSVQSVHITKLIILQL